MNNRPICKNCKHFEKVNKYKERGAKPNPIIRVICKQKGLLAENDTKHQKEIIQTILKGDSLPMACFETT